MNFANNFSEADAETFRGQGFVVVEKFLGSAWASGLFDECQRLKHAKLYSAHKFRFGSQLFEKPNIYELDLHDRVKREQSKYLTEIFDSVGPTFVSNAKRLVPELHLDETPSAIKMQFNAGNNGCFPWHYDNAGPPSKRQLTCIVYLNKNWKEGDGGELVLLPFLSSPIKIAPLFNRAVLFQSDKHLHRVLPSVKERFCFTVWCDGLKVNSDNDVLLSKDHLKFTSFDQAEAFFQNSPLQRVISRAVYNDEYKESLIQCVGGTAGEKIMVMHHEMNVQNIYRKLQPLIDEFRRRKVLIQQA
jgi:hypothetical protein